MSNWRGGGSGGLGESRVLEIVRENQRVLVPNVDGSYPDAELEKGLITPETFSIGHEQVHHATAPTGTFSEITPASFAGVFVSGARPSAAANTGRYLWNKGVGSWQVGETDGWGGFQASGWANTGPPAFARPWRGAHESEAAALAHVQASGDKVIYGDRLYQANNDYVAGTERESHITWQSVSENIIVPVVTMYVWRNGEAMGARPDDATELTAIEVGKLTPISLAVGMIYLHIDLPLAYVLDVVYIAGRNRFSNFTARTTATRRIYDSATLGTSSAIDILVRLQESA